MFVNLRVVDGSISIHALLAESDQRCFTYYIGRFLFLSTLSLRRATVAPMLAVGRAGYFYPRSPCGERRVSQWTATWNVSFLSTLSLRRATRCFTYYIGRFLISIHALLAESDSRHSISCMIHTHFYPRSPCGERLGNVRGVSVLRNFYPRSPCGERQGTIQVCCAM